jgi:hypothetical protein
VAKILKQKRYNVVKEVMHKKAISVSTRRLQMACLRVSYLARVVLQTLVEKGGVVGIDNSGGDPAIECSKQSERGGVW